MRIMVLLCTVGLLAATTAGCQTHTALQEHTLKTSGTLAELNCQQVVDNLARVRRGETLANVVDPARGY